MAKVIGLKKFWHEKIALDLQMLLDALPYYVIVIDSDHRILLANKAVQGSLGVEPEKIIGAYCPKAIHGMDKPFPGCPLDEAIKKGGPAERDLYDERYGIWMKSAIYPTKIFTVQGKQVFFHTALDVTNQKLAQEELEKADEELHKAQQELEKRVKERTSELLKSNIKLQATLKGTVHVLASIVETRDSYTAGHQKRVAELACAIAKEMKLTDDQIEGINVAGTLHDIGKIFIPAEILNKPSIISELEFSLIKTHPQVGYEILKGIQFPWPVAKIVWQHHERIDGSGYPLRLSSGKIMLEAKILAVADVVEAMSSHRPYRPALGLHKALVEIANNKGVLYEPEVVDVCLRLFAKKEFKF